MALLAETLVEEWLNRQGFFTIRGVKEGVDEIDLLAVRRTDGRTIPEAWHVEVQASFRPIGYMTPLTPQLCDQLNVKRTAYTVKRTTDQLGECVDAWIENKFNKVKKVRRRESLWKGLEWQRVLVHGVVLHAEELDCFTARGIKIVPLEKVLTDLCPEKKRPAFTASAGGDLADLIHFHSSNKQRVVDESVLPPEVSAGE